MPVRDDDEQRLARIDDILKHLHELEKDAGKIISSLQRERHRTRAVRIAPRQNASDRTTSRKARKKR